MSRQFEVEHAIRKAIPLFLGLWGPSGSGKTYTALRIAQGIQKVYPGPIILIDTENGRGLHYASIFDYEYIDFQPPYGSEDYLEVIKYAESKKPSVIILDSATHEHSGPEGYLETHEKIMYELAKKWNSKPDSTSMAAWAQVSAKRKKLINYITRMQSNIILCFRAKEKNAPVRDSKTGKTKIENLGYMPDSGKEYVFEMTLSCLLPPGSKGHPVFQTGNRGEDLMTKLPEQFRYIFENKDVQLDEKIGEMLATWSKGDVKQYNPTPSSEKPSSKDTQPSELDFQAEKEDGEEKNLHPNEKKFLEYESVTKPEAFNHYLKVCSDNGWTDDVVNWAIGKLKENEA